MRPPPSPTEQNELAARGLVIADRALGLVRGPTCVRDAAADAAVDAVLWCLAEYDPARGSFDAFAWRSVRLFISRAINRVRTQARPLSPLLADNYPGPADAPPLDWLAQLPGGYKDAARLVCLEGHSLQSAAARLGLASPESVRKRLVRAAAAVENGTSSAIPRAESLTPSQPMTPTDTVIEAIEDYLAITIDHAGRIRQNLPAVAKLSKRSRLRVLTSLAGAADAFEQALLNALVPTSPK